MTPVVLFHIDYVHNAEKELKAELDANSAKHTQTAEQLKARLGTLAADADRELHSLDLALSSLASDVCSVFVLRCRCVWLNFERVLFCESQ